MSASDGAALWQRWGHLGNDRLYVTTPDGARVGWVDLRTGERTLELMELREPFERAVAAQLAEAVERPAEAVERALVALSSTTS